MLFRFIMYDYCVFELTPPPHPALHGKLLGWRFVFELGKYQSCSVIKRSSVRFGIRVQSCPVR